MTEVIFEEDQINWKVPEMILYLSDYFELVAGNAILSGTPSGVGSVNRCGTFEMAADALGVVTVRVTKLHNRGGGLR